MGDFQIEDGVLIQYNGNDEMVTIPNSVTAIRLGAFNDCKNLKKINIPNSVKSVSGFEYPFNYDNIAHDLVYFSKKESHKIKIRVYENRMCFDLEYLSNKIIDAFINSVDTPNGLFNTSRFHAHLLDYVPKKNVETIFKYIRLKNDSNSFETMFISMIVLNLMSDNVSIMDYIYLYSEAELEKIIEVAMSFEANKCIMELLNYKNTHFGFDSNIDEFSID